MDRRTVNELRMRSFASAPLIAFVCECESDGCRRTVALTPDEYRILRDDGRGVIFPGHVPIEDLPLAADPGSALTDASTPVPPAA